ncbi:MAG TPA: enoyl-CoA hydratase-related protein [Candidatus Krumholzibacteria bacterium]|nr:enoyl-CoA hydratase-related protein [Candidatus Krumholzibacteria bacterium]HPD70654.1 enoyl-CoA hydratase-related protein [Candidatus Krumholzibacteria bacterium]HRY39646.1 enoyl-CoA hydratase-related protein [Candidatus Krumholzibacteria bacterium]
MQEIRSTCRATADERGVVELVLDRPDKHNALSAGMVRELDELLRWGAAVPGLRALVVRATGKVFSAGADLADMQLMAGAERQENLDDAVRLAKLLRRLDTFPRPVLAVVQGSAFGGAVGLCCCCDTAIAAPQARFCLSEARLGLAAAVISPYVVRALGPRLARHCALTAEMVDAAAALRYGLVHEVVDDVDAGVRRWLAAVLQGAPGAQAAVKDLVQRVHGHPVNDSLIRETALVIADLRARPEGREGLEAFLAKRPPAWAPRKE